MIGHKGSSAYCCLRVYFLVLIHACALASILTHCYCCTYCTIFYATRQVRGVVNLCEEYRGPDRSYKQLGMRHLHLPTTDHFEPTVRDLERAVQFIAEHEALGKKVYVHCRAGHGRSAAVVFAWLITKDPDADLQQLNQQFCRLRDVRKTLWKQRSVVRFHSRLRLRKDGSGGSGGSLRSNDGRTATATLTNCDQRNNKLANVADRWTLLLHGF